jgi:outer membrane protein OmpA-like peptidoglycan-associated protein
LVGRIAWATRCANLRPRNRPDDIGLGSSLEPSAAPNARASSRDKARCDADKSLTDVGDVFDLSRIRPPPVNRCPPGSATQPEQLFKGAPLVGAPGWYVVRWRAPVPSGSPMRWLRRFALMAVAVTVGLAALVFSIVRAHWVEGPAGPAVAVSMPPVASSTGTGAADLASAEREREEAKVTTNQLRKSLAAAEQRVSDLEAANAGLSADVQAASDAADVARQNLQSITSEVGTLTAALTGAAPESSGLKAPAAANSEARQEAARPDQDLGGRDEGSAIAKMEESEQSVGLRAVGERPVESGLGADPAIPTEPEEKLQLQALLVDLDPAVGPRGLLMTVPGGVLFRTDSDEIDQTSYPTLAKIAELISIYRTHQVLIVGHTDASREAAYNQMLSKRRADLVKQFLVANFDIDAARLATEGKGEEAPIASNGTHAGREANRRVEVLLLN